MRIQVFQHVGHEGAGSIIDWADDRSHQIILTRMYDNQAPLLDGDGLIILGGPMSIYDEVEYPWLIEEKRLIREFLSKGGKVLGICLGSQLIADALGARVYQNDRKEIGWMPIKTERKGTFAVFDGGDIMTFHWHGDTFELPSQAIALAHSIATKIQAFQFGENVLALQCHFEIDGSLADSMIDGGQAELDAGGIFVQSEREIRAGLERYGSNVKSDLYRILDRFFG